MHYLIGNKTYLNILIHGRTFQINRTSTTFSGTEASYVNPFYELKKIYVTHNNVGFEWKNIISSDTLIILYSIKQPATIYILSNQRFTRHYVYFANELIIMNSITLVFMNMNLHILQLFKE